MFSEVIHHRVDLSVGSTDGTALAAALGARLLLLVDSHSDGCRFFNDHIGELMIFMSRVQDLLVVHDKFLSYALRRARWRHLRLTDGNAVASCRSCLAAQRHCSFVIDKVSHGLRKSLLAS